MFMRLWKWLRPSPAEPQQAADEFNQTGTVPDNESDGRRRLPDVPYLLPKDLGEINRLDFQHYVLRLALGQLTFAPVDQQLRQGGQVLDVGCGTGRWAIEIARQYPLTQVTGLDLELVKATTPPPNYRFIQGNLLQGLPFADRTFHYTHQRFLVAAIPLEHWPGTVQELYRVTTPGGWIELIELGAETRNAGPNLQQLIAWGRQLSALRGIDATHMSRLNEWLLQAGCSQIHTHTLWLPLGAWAGRLGLLCIRDFAAGFAGLEALAVRTCGISPAHFRQTVAALEQECNQHQTRYACYLAAGQR
ncbi:MAG: class I SAM-dependent methyltransferase [Thermogemmatispora sp.]|uniref:class I SAM-dependent methyltransferase n=1 Tax=Thermogemmatispora sp. TaxID=1968838 RepID=UPI00262E70F6|nr:class I SAM-dependent methyltransferase [Thermogemmatispora sp.]MBX5459348.1 class I SAM-dependent methyltransferase [Thermogemmatispora sp.]